MPSSISPVPAPITQGIPLSPAFERVHRHVLTNPPLLERLCAETDHEAFVTLFVELAVDQGECIHPDEVRAALKTCRREWLQRIIL